jgi:hypothetical protein
MVSAGPNAQVRLCVGTRAARSWRCCRYHPLYAEAGAGSRGARCPRWPQSVEVAPRPRGWRPVLAVTGVLALTGIGAGAFAGLAELDWSRSTPGLDDQATWVQTGQARRLALASTLPWCQPGSRTLEQPRPTRSGRRNCRHSSTIRPTTAAPTRTARLAPTRGEPPRLRTGRASADALGCTNPVRWMQTRYERGRPMVTRPPHLPLNALRPRSLPGPGVVARTGPAANPARSPERWSPTPNAQGNTHPTTDLPKNANDPAAVTDRQTTAPAAGGPLAEAVASCPYAVPCAGGRRNARGRQPLPRGAR